MPPNDREFTVRLRGESRDLNRVRLTDFRDFLTALSSILRLLDHRVSGKRQTTFRISDLSASSAEVTIEAVPSRGRPDIAGRLIDRFLHDLEAIQEGPDLASKYDKELLDAYRQLTIPLNRHVTEVEVLRGVHKVRVTRQLGLNIEKMLGRVLVSSGTLTGFLDAVNVHGENYFYVYPLVGPTKVRCIFSDEMLDMVRAGIKQYVDVGGTLYYREKETFPFQIEVKDIEIHPPADRLPTLASLRGMAPSATRGIDSVAFIRALRDADKT